MRADSYILLQREKQCRINVRGTRTFIKCIVWICLYMICLSFAGDGVVVVIGAAHSPEPPWPDFLVGNSIPLRFVRW